MLISDTALAKVHEFARLRYNLFLDNFTANPNATIGGLLGTYCTEKQGHGIFGVAKFTNVFRFLDRVSQGAVKIANLNGLEPDNYAALIYLFRLFNNLDTWERFPYKEEPVAHLGDIQPWIDNETAQGRSVYGRAYLLSSAFPYSIYVEILKDLISTGNYKRLLYDENLAHKYDTLHEYKGFGEFLAYQFALDFSYYNVNVDDYDTFVVPGVGAVRGASRIFNNISKRKLGFVMADIAREWKPDFKFFGWSIKGNDVQNVFCEFDKYARTELTDMPVTKGRARTNTRKYTATKAPYEIYFPRSFVNGFEAQRIYEFTLADENPMVTKVPAAPTVEEQLSEYNEFTMELSHENR